MTNQQGDQNALNKLVDDCYGGQWPWRTGDLLFWPRNPHYISHISSISEKDIELDNGVTMPLWEINFYPLAGTWVEGRLRELIGEAFRSLSIDGKRFVCEIERPTWSEDRIKASQITGHWGPTPIQALCAALRAVLEAQKEVKDDR